MVLDLERARKMHQNSAHSEARVRTHALPVVVLQDRDANLMEHAKSLYAVMERDSGHAHKLNHYFAILERCLIHAARADARQEKHAWTEDAFVLFLRSPVMFLHDLHLLILLNQQKLFGSMETKKHSWA